MPVGHPDLKPVRRHPPDHAPRPRHRQTVRPRGVSLFPGRRERTCTRSRSDRCTPGIIEPGHFRFQAHGEEVLYLEIMLGYQHRGVERLLETPRPHRAVLVAESIAGDTVIGHGGAYCSAIEALARCAEDAARPGHSRDRPRAGAAGQSHRRPRRHRGRHRLSARRGLFRPHARRVPQPAHDAQRQPLRPGLDPAGRSPVRHSARHGRRQLVERLQRLSRRAAVRWPT